ncbi:hypothetical protein GJ700_01290 [Duganella sp. FT92W]|uniref:Uncharacterized protein n=1 Tax=Pseudoduganella rivuli TaxID=2666085 RepID=A0A7X2IHZ0_9BURK|nr:hypothetical protein [Pseudoduganella rivuli]MRV70354.1 hypothetical protein [Pseudoduganella rivuli]
MREHASDADRFGVPAENIQAAERRNTDYKPQRTPINLRVPTRKEVRQLPRDELAPLLIGWMEHSPIEIVPSRGQIQLVIEVLQQRPDVADVAPLINMCRNYSSDS